MDRLYIFDFDGTLSYTGDDIALSVQIIQKKYGAPVTDVKSILAFVGYGAKYLIENTVTAGLAQKAAAEWTANGAAADGPSFETIYRDYMDVYYEHAADTSRLYPGVRETLVKLAGRGDRIALFTNKPKRVTARTLDFLGIKDFFEVILCPEDLTRRKPDPEGIFKCVEMTGSDLSRTLMVGDSRADIDAGKAAGVKTLGLLNGMGDREKLLAAGPDFTAEHFGDVLSVEF